MLLYQRSVISAGTVSYTHLRAHETSQDLVCRRRLEKGGSHKSGGKDSHPGWDERK
ncbi:hypothetical protein ACX3V1_13120 [Escherichia coli]